MDLHTYLSNAFLLLVMSLVKWEILRQFVQPVSREHLVLGNLFHAKWFLGGLSLALEEVQESFFMHSSHPVVKSVVFPTCGGLPG